MASPRTQAMGVKGAGGRLGWLLAAALWIPQPAWTTAALGIGLSGWLWLRGLRSEHARVPWMAVVALWAGSVPMIVPDLSPLTTAICLGVVAGAFPAYLWLEDARRSLTRAEFAALVVLQPGVAILHHWLELHPRSLSDSIADGLQAVFVATALVQSGLALIRTDPQRIVIAIAQSQAALVLAGVLGEEHGWAAARTMLTGVSIGSAVLLAALFEVHRRYGVERLSHRHALADLEPRIHAATVACGWAFVGVPGGLTFFAEDLLFHELVHRSPLATVLFVVTTGFNAIAFYRMYLGVFCGSRRDHHASSSTQQDALPSLAPRGLHAFLLGGTVLLYVLGFAPMLLL